VAVAVACTLTGLAVDRFDARHPVPSQLVYVLDRDTGQARWASTEARPGAYTAHFVDAHEPLGVDYPYLAGTDVWTGPAEAAALPAPAVTTVSDRVAGDRREITVRVRPQRPGVRLVALDVGAGTGTVVDGRVEGRDVAREALGQHRLRITFHAPPADGVEVTVVVGGGAVPTLRVIDGSDGLDGLPGVLPRPAGVAAAGTHSSDLVLVSATVPVG
jgi:hypothetical protein